LIPLYISPFQIWDRLPLERLAKKKFMVPEEMSI
jgi:hypothetical protein